MVARMVALVERERERTDGAPASRRPRSGGGARQLRPATLNSREFEQNYWLPALLHGGGRILIFKGRRAMVPVFWSLKSDEDEVPGRDDRCRVRCPPHPRCGG